MTRWVCGFALVVLLASQVVAQQPAGKLPPGLPAPGVDGVPNRPRPVRPAAGNPIVATKFDRHGDPLPAGAITRYGTVRLRHGPEPLALAFTQDGKYLGSLSNTNDGIRLWDPKTGKEVGRLNSPVQCASLARDGSVVFIDDSRCRHWVPVANTIRDLPEKTVPENVQCIAANPNLRSFAVGAPQKVTLIDLESGKALRELKYPGDQCITRLVYSSDGRWLAGSGPNTGIYLWDLRSFKRVRTYHSEHNYPEYSFSTDGTRIAIAGDKIGVYPTDAEELLEGYKPIEGQFHNPRFSADGKWLYAISPNGDVVQIDAATGEAKEPLAAPDMTFHPPVAVSPEGAFAAAIDQSGGIRIWDPKTGKGPEAERLPTLIQPGFSADGKSVSALTIEGRIHTFDVATGKPAKVIDLPVDESEGVNWDSRARRATAVVGGEEFELQVIDLDSLKIVGKLPVPASAGLPVPSFCASDRNRVALFLQGSVMICNVTTGKILRTLTFGKADESPPSHGAISPDGRLVAVTASGSTPITVWEVTTGKKRFTFDALPSAVGVCFSADGCKLVGWDAQGNVVVFDLRSGTVARRFQMDGDGGDGISVAISNDGKRLAIGGHDGRIAVWNVTTGDPVVTFDRHDGFVTGMTWNRDGTQLASSATDGTVLVWDVPLKVSGATEVVVAGYDEAFRLLGSSDPANAQRGMELLYRNPVETTKQCAERIVVPAAAAAGRMAKLIVDLDDEDFPVRAAAVKELHLIGAESLVHLRKVVDKSPSAEVRNLAKEVITRIEMSPPTPEDLRALRAIEVLENLGTSEAQAVLKKWASGPEGHRLATEANAALTRLKTRGN